MLRILTLREGTWRSRHPDTDAREADVSSVALAALRHPERAAVRDGRPKPTNLPPGSIWFFGFPGGVASENKIVFCLSAVCSGFQFAGTVCLLAKSQQHI